jgi:hypothetical protein
MQSFSYVARSTDGTIHRGTIESEDVLAARAALGDRFEDILDLQQLRTPEEPVEYAYYPLVATLRLYAGWLLALIVVYEVLGPLFGWQQNAFFRNIACAAFVFLLATTLHRKASGGVILAALLSVACIGIIATVVVLG